MLYSVCLALLGVCSYSTMAISTGSGVVDNAIAQIHNSAIFPNDHKFLRRIAWVESKFGKDLLSASNFQKNGGIWQIDPIGLANSQRDTETNRRKFAKIQAKFGIIYRNINRNNGDLQDPLRGALVARMFLSQIPSPIPSDLNGQAHYWKRHYNTEAGAGTVQKFINDVQALEG